MSGDFMHPLAAILANAREDNAELFGGIDEKAQKALDQRIALDEEKARTIAAAWARFYTSPDGRMALEVMFDQTVRRQMFFVQLGLDAQSIQMFGAFREGQNALATEIARQIAKGLHIPEPSPRKAE